MPGRSKAEFLQSVREALGRTEGPPDELYHHLQEDLPLLESQASELEGRLRANRPQILDRFVEMAAKGGWNVHRVAGADGRHWPGGLNNRGGWRHPHCPLGPDGIRRRTG
jgi:hypothetical protein